MEQTSGIDTFRENLRLQQVYNVMLRYGLDMAFTRLGVLGSLRQRMQRWLWNLPDDLEIPSLPAKVRLMLEDLGPTYVKVGQIVSSQASVIPSDWVVELEKLQSDVPPFPEEQVRATILKELKAQPEDLFASFNLQPLAAASTAQVHRAVLPDGTEVVVKIQRPNIHDQMKADVGIMRNATRVLSSRIRELRAFDLTGMVDEFGSNAIRELNYVGEAYNAMRLAKNMATCPGVHVCTMYPAYSTSRVLTMEFVRGVKINDVTAIDAAGIDRETLATNTLRAMVKQLMIDGFFHADPHPGNILVDVRTGNVTFIDTGMVGEIDVQQRVNLIQLLASLQAQDVDGAAAVLKNLSVPFQGPIDEKEYYKDFQRSLGPYMVGGASLDFGQSLSTAMDVLRRNGLRMDPNLTLTIKALMQVQAIGDLIFPEGSLVVKGVEIAREEAMKLVTADKITGMANKAASTLLREVSGNLPTLSGAATSWLNQFRKGRLEVYLDTTGLTKEVKTVNRFGRQAIIALMLVGLIIGSAIATTGIALGNLEGPFWRFLAQIAVLGYVFSSIITALIVLRLIWHWLRGRDPETD